MTKGNELQVILDEQGVAQENANQLIKAFGAPFEEAGKILAEYESIVVTKEDQFDLMADARTKRLALKNIRVGVEHKRKELKEDSVKTGRAIDSVAKFVKDIIEPAEEYLEKQEKFGEIKAAERKAKVLADRVSQLSKYMNDPLGYYKLDEMDDEQFANALQSAKSVYDSQQAELKKIEDDRIAKEKADREAHELAVAENERLTKEAEERDRKDAEQRKIAEENERKIAAEREAERKAAQDKIDAECQKREALEAEQRKARELELEKQAKADEEKRQSLLAPDKDKLLTLASEIEKTELPALASKDAQAVLNEVETLLAKVSTYIRENVKGL